MESEETSDCLGLCQTCTIATAESYTFDMHAVRKRKSGRPELQEGLRPVL